MTALAGLTLVATGGLTVGQAVASGAVLQQAGGLFTAKGGNSGVIMLDGIGFDSHSDNEPHIGCDFRVSFYNFPVDPASGPLTANVTFTTVGSSSDVGLTVTGNTAPWLGEDPAEGSGDLDAEQDYTLAFDGEPDTQGYHVRLNVTTSDANGNGKSKTFWVSDCGTTDPGTDPPLNKIYFRLSIQCE
jgi:hypothetical protein